MPESMTEVTAMTWCDAEFKNVNLGDKRLNNRLRAIADDLARSPMTSIPDAIGTMAGIKAAYRFFENRDVDSEEIWQAHARSTVERAEGHSSILVVQDTTWLDFSTHKATRGLGYHTHLNDQGLLLHSAMAITTEGLPLGIIDHFIWIRQNKEFGKRKRYHSHKFPLHKRESYRWIKSARRIMASMPSSVQVIHVADREADITDLFKIPRRPGDELLIRSNNNRRIVHKHAEYLYELEKIAPTLGRIRVNIQHSRDRRARQARVSIKAAEVSLRPRPAKGEPIKLYAVWALEELAPEGVEPVYWRLLTTMPAQTFKKAAFCVHSYALRWLIERYHFVLKSGCKCEDLQLESSTRIGRALPIFAVMAWHLLWLTYRARLEPCKPCAPELSRDEWETLYLVHNKSTQLPDEPPSLETAIRWLAGLSGFISHRRGDPPGVEILWKAYRKLGVMVATRNLLGALYEMTPR